MSVPRVRGAREPGSTPWNVGTPRGLDYFFVFLRRASSRFLIALMRRASAALARPRVDPAVAVEASVVGIDGIQDARLIPDARDEDAQCVLRVIANGGSNHGRLRREILRVVVPRGMVREVDFVDQLEFTRSGKPLRRV